MCFLAFIPEGREGGGRGGGGQGCRTIGIAMYLFWGRNYGWVVILGSGCVESR